MFDTLRRTDSSLSRMEKAYARVAKRVFSSVEIQTMFTWIEKTKKPTRLTVKHKDKIITPSYEASISSQTTTTSNTDTFQFLLHVRLTKKIVNKSSKSQHSRVRLCIWSFPTPF